MTTTSGLSTQTTVAITSAQAPWFDGWLRGDPERARFYIEAEQGFDTSRVVRPRTTPLFHLFSRPDGSRVAAWTTFGPDQVDVNVQEPAVLLELTDVLLGYLLRGAGAVRLDAIGFLWKTTGTRCLHLPQTHALIKVWRAMVDEVLPGARLITETNVPHQDNISYFGDGTDEATMVYQFALPPLVLHAFVREDASRLGAWARTIDRVSDTATWFNFLASHDGIGLRPTEGILDDVERAALVERTQAVGGAVSMASLPDGSETVYELNVSYLDALCTPEELSSPDVVAAKAQAAHSILLTMIGIPAIYLHSLLGTGSDRDGMLASGSRRRINRPVLDADRLEAELLADPRRRSVFHGLRRLLALRRTLPALSPFGTQRTLDLDPSVLAILRGAGSGDELLCITNVTPRPVVLEAVWGTDLVTGLRCAPLELEPWGFAWVRPD